MERNMIESKCRLYSQLCDIAREHALISLACYKRSRQSIHFASAMRAFKRAKDYRNQAESAFALLRD